MQGCPDYMRKDLWQTGTVIVPVLYARRIRYSIGKLTGQIMSTEDNYDYWTEGPSARGPSPKPTLTVEMIEQVVPLGTQFGVVEPFTVPAALQEFMFGQPEPTEAEIAGHHDDPDEVPQLHTYAILDAAKVTNLPEMLDTSDLPHRCLFKGDAFDELKHVAPWIVQLEDNAAFTRNLFTKSDAPWHLWGYDAGIYVRSRSSLDDLWKHFRKFTKIQDDQGKWFYWRFWEGIHIGAMLQEMDAKDQMKFFMYCKVQSILAIQTVAPPNVLKMSLRAA